MIEASRAIFHKANTEMLQRRQLRQRCFKRPHPIKKLTAINAQLFEAAPSTPSNF